MVLFQQSDVGEGEVASFALALALPLAVHVDLGHFYHVSHLSNVKTEDKCGHKTNIFSLSLLGIDWQD